MNVDSAKKQRKEFVWGQLSISLCGLFIVVKKSTSKEQEGISGIIVQETSNLLQINSKNKLVWIQKKNRVFEIELSDKSRVIVNGNLLLGKPEERVKRKFFNW